MLGLLPITVSSPGVGLLSMQKSVYLLLPIHVVFYCSFRLAPRCPASTLVKQTYGNVRRVYTIQLASVRLVQPYSKNPSRSLLAECVALWGEPEQAVHGMKGKRATIWLPAIAFALTT